MIAIIPVKLSVRLPGKHLMKIGEKTIIEHVYQKVSKVFETYIYSKIDLPLPFIHDKSENIMDLVFNLKKRYGTFAMIGGDMVFFNENDLKILKESYRGGPVVPGDGYEDYEPMFSIYSGEPKLTRNLREALTGETTVYIPKSKFSKYAFYNINTSEDYRNAISIYDELKNNDF